MENRRDLLMIWVIGTAVFGSISLWIVGMLFGGIGIDFDSIGGHFALLLGGAIFGAGVGLMLVPIVKWVSSALAGDRLALWWLGISAIVSIVCARVIWWGSGGNPFLTILGALLGVLLTLATYKYIGGIMGFMDIFKRKSSPSRGSTITTKEDVISLFEEITGDYETALFLADVEDNMGRYGYIQFKQGGHGSPYDVEYQSTSKHDNKSAKDIKSEINKLSDELNEMLGSEKYYSEPKREYLEKRIAELSGGLCTILINVESNEEFEQKSQLLKRAYRTIGDLLRDI